MSTMMTTVPIPSHPVKSGAARFFAYMRAVEASSLTATQRHLAITVARFAGTGTCYASNATLAKATGRSDKTIRDNLHRLADAGWLVLEQTPKGQPNVWHMPSRTPVTVTDPPGNHYLDTPVTTTANIPSTSPRTSPPLPSRERTRETTQPLGGSSVDGRGGEQVKDQEDQDTTPERILTPPRPCLPLGCAPGRPPESERGEAMMTPAELHTEVVKAQRARKMAGASPHVGWKRGDLPYLAATFTRWELMRALRVVSDAKISSPRKALCMALEGDWTFPGEGARALRKPEEAKPRSRYAPSANHLHVYADTPNPIWAGRTDEEIAASRAEGRRHLEAMKRLLAEGVAA